MMSYDDDDDDADDVMQYWPLLLLVVFPVLTVFGNVLVCLSVYRERSLQTVTNYFIVSLAIASSLISPVSSHLSTRQVRRGD